MAEGGGLFSSFRSKHKSESGNWEKDSDHSSCQACSAAFSFSRRRHHCRRCGRIYCGQCCNNQVFIDGLSRSGKPKRICDECFRRERGLDDEGADAAAPGEAAPADDDAAGATNPYTVAGITEAEAVANLEGAAPFEGPWCIRLVFKRVELGGAMMASDAHVYLPGATAAGGAANLIAPGKKKKRRSVAPTTLVVGARRSVDVELARKTGSYFTGEGMPLAPFGDKGTVKGSIQLMSGKVQFTLTYTSAGGVKMQMNFTGVLNGKGEVVGLFNGTEIAKEAGSVGGTFTLYCPNETTGEEEELAAEEAEEAAAGAEGEGEGKDTAFAGAQAEGAS